MWGPYRVHQRILVLDKQLERERERAVDCFGNE